MDTKIIDGVVYEKKDLTYISEELRLANNRLEGAKQSVDTAQSEVDAILAKLDEYKGQGVTLSQDLVDQVEAITE